MTDVFNVEKRSQVMRQIKSRKNKSTELRLLKVFRSLNITGWMRNYQVKGHPDFVFMHQRVAVFVDGCFWHGHNCRNTTPKQNCEYWQQKISRNKIHDAEITTHFLNRGWKVLRIWECELKKSNRDRLIESLQNAGVYSPNTPVERKEVL